MIPTPSTLDLLPTQGSTPKTCIYIHYSRCDQPFPTHFLEAPQTTGPNSVDSIDLSTNRKPPNLRIPTLTPACCSISFRCAASCDRDFDADVMWLFDFTYFSLRMSSPHGFVGWLVIHPFILGNGWVGNPTNPVVYVQRSFCFATKKLRGRKLEFLKFCQQKKHGKNTNWIEKRPSLLFGRGGFLDWMIL